MLQQKQGLKAFTNSMTFEFSIIWWLIQSDLGLKHRFKFLQDWGRWVHWALQKVREAISSCGCCGILCETKSNRHAPAPAIRLSTAGKAEGGTVHLFMHPSRSKPDLSTEISCYCWALSASRHAQKQNLWQAGKVKIRSRLYWLKVLKD